MITKKYIKSRKVTQATFVVPTTELPENVVISDISLLGDFNNWESSANPMAFNKRDNAYKATIELPAGTYHYRYLINGYLWYNDWEADDYATSDSGADNCLVEIEAA